MNGRERRETKSNEINGSSLVARKVPKAWFDPTYAHKLFLPFQRHHRADEFPGTESVWQLFSESFAGTAEP